MTNVIKNENISNQGNIDVNAAMSLSQIMQDGLRLPVRKQKFDPTATIPVPPKYAKPNQSNNHRNNRIKIRDASQIRGNEHYNQMKQLRQSSLMLLENDISDALKKQHGNMTNLFKQQSKLLSRYTVGSRKDAQNYIVKNKEKCLLMPRDKLINAFKHVRSVTHVMKAINETKYSQLNSQNNHKNEFKRVNSEMNKQYISNNQNNHNNNNNNNSNIKQYYKFKKSKLPKISQILSKTHNSVCKQSMCLECGTSMNHKIRSRVFLNRIKNWSNLFENPSNIGNNHNIVDSNIASLRYELLRKAKNNAMDIIQNHKYLTCDETIKTLANIKLISKNANTDALKTIKYLNDANTAHYTLQSKNRKKIDRTFKLIENKQSHFHQFLQNFWIQTNTLIGSNNNNNINNNNSNEKDIEYSMLDQFRQIQTNQTKLSNETESILQDLDHLILRTKCQNDSTIEKFSNALKNFKKLRQNNTVNIKKPISATEIRAHNKKHTKRNKGSNSISQSESNSVSKQSVSFETDIDSNGSKLDSDSNSESLVSSQSDLTQIKHKKANTHSNKTNESLNEIACENININIKLDSICQVINETQKEIETLRLTNYKNENMSIDYALNRIESMLARTNVIQHENVIDITDNTIGNNIDRNFLNESNEANGSNITTYKATQLWNKQMHSIKNDLNKSEQRNKQLEKLLRQAMTRIAIMEQTRYER